MTVLLRSLLIAAATAATAGCTRTAITSLPAPELRGRSYHSILVVAQIADLGLRVEMENRFKLDDQQCVYRAQVQGHGAPSTVDSLYGICMKGRTRFVPSHAVFLPGRDYSSDQVMAAMREDQIDATLVIAPGATGSTQGYVPPTYTTSCTGYDIYSGCSQAMTTTSSGDYSLSKPWAQFSAKLFDAANGQLEWVATAFSTGNGFARSADLVRSMADKTLERLLADKVVQ